MIKARKLFNGVALGLIAIAPLGAQSGLGHLEDASTAPRGLLRLRAATIWTRYDSRFTASGQEPLGGFLTADALGSAKLPSLATLESQVASAAASPFSLSLGRSRLDATAREEIVPILFEYGVTSRLSVSAMLPVVRKRVHVQLQLDTAGGFAANVGPNPHRTSPAAVATNAQVQAEFADAASDLQALLSQCATTPALPQCASVNGREAQAAALVAASQQFATDVGAIYGTSATVTGSAFVPMNGSSAQSAIVQRVTGFNTEYQSFLGGNPLTQTPIAAGGPAGVADLQRYLTQEQGRDSVVLKEQVSVGDWELGVKFRAIDRKAATANALGLQLVLAGGIRFPSGSRQSGTEVADLRSGAGQTVVNTRAITDARVGRFGVLATADFAVGVAGSNMSSIARDSRWTELHVAPRYHFSDPFAIHGAYSLRTANETGGDQLAGAGFTFTTVSKWAGGTLPMEMRYTHLESISGDAGRPRLFRDQVELRLYYPLLKR